VTRTQAGGMVDLGTLPGGTNSRATAVDNGQVVGYAMTAGAEFVEHAFSWTQAGGMVDLGEGEAIAVSNGQVVGYNAGGHAFSWTQEGGMVDLGTLGPFSRASDVSDGQGSWARREPAQSGTQCSG